MSLDSPNDTHPGSTLDPGPALEPSARFRDLSPQSVDLVFEALSSAPAWIVATDREGRITFCNQALDGTREAPRKETSQSAEGRTGSVAASKVCGTRFVDWLIPDSALPAERVLRGAIHHGEDGCTEIRLSHSTELPLTLNARPLIVEGEIQGAALVLSKVASLRQLELERQSLQRRAASYQKMESLGVLAGGVAHDFNNLLVGVLGNADLLRQRFDSGTLEHELICGIEQAAQRASELCEQMLAYAGRSQIEPSVIDLSLLLDELVPELNGRLSPEITMKLRLKSNLPKIRGDHDQIVRVALALISNAADALGNQPGAIRIATGVQHLGTEQLAAARIGDFLPTGDYVLLEVEDNGEGIEEDHLSKIFEPFYTTRFAGRGLGLAAAHGIVRAHGGGLQINSVPGQGTTARVLFPVKSRLLPITAELEAVRRPLPEKQHVLLAHHDESTARDAEAGLRALGFEVSRAANGGEALQLFAADPARFSLLVVALNMPKMHGDELLLAVRKRSRSTPVILMSGLSRSELVTRLPRDKHLHFLGKPLRIEELDRVVAEATETDSGSRSTS